MLRDRLTVGENEYRVELEKEIVHEGQKQMIGFYGKEKKISVSNELQEDKHDRAIMFGIFAAVLYEAEAGMSDSKASKIADLLYFTLKNNNIQF